MLRDQPPSGGEAPRTKKEDAMNATAMKMVGTALLWVALAALVNVPSAGTNAYAIWIAVMGFVSFAAGLAFFAEGLKRDIVAQLRG